MVDEDGGVPEHGADKDGKVLKHGADRDGEVPEPGTDEGGKVPEHDADEDVGPPQLPTLAPRGDGSVMPPLTEDVIALVPPGEDPPPLSLRHLAPGFMLENEVSGRCGHGIRNTKSHSISHQ